MTSSETSIKGWKGWKIVFTILGIIIIILLLSLFGFIPLAGEQNNHLNILVENKSVITFIAIDETSKANMSSYNIQKPEELQIPSNINKFDVVTFNHTLLNAYLKSGKGITVSIGEKEYQMELSPTKFENITRLRETNDDGIYSYQGTLDGVNSDFLFTTSKNVIIGDISINGETFWIIPVEPRARTEISMSPLHIIYSSKNVRNVQFKID